MKVVNAACSLVGFRKNKNEDKKNIVAYNPFGHEDYLARGRARPRVERGWRCR